VPLRGHHPGPGIQPCVGARGEAGADAGQADKILLVNLSGRGDKDMHTVAEKSGITF
jgi:hypothetical protein